MHCEVHLTVTFSLKLFTCTAINVVEFACIHRLSVGNDPACTRSTGNLSCNAFSKRQESTCAAGERNIIASGDVPDKLSRDFLIYITVMI